MHTSKLPNKIIRGGNREKISTLLTNGADVNSRDLKGKTTVWWAAFNGNVELTQFLIDKKADINIPDSLGRTPLDVASELALRGYREPGEKNNHEAILHLLQIKAQPLIEDEKITALADKLSKFGIYDSKPLTNQVKDAKEEEIDAVPEDKPSRCILM